MIGRFYIFRIVVYLGAILTPVLYFTCAGRGRPGGGPVDKIRPTVIATYPSPDSTGLNHLEEIEIIFSERMNEASTGNSIFISPPLTYETDWSGGDELTLMINQSLTANQTYVITIGSGAMDTQKNRMSESYQFAFSTGDVLDRGEIFGRVFDISSKDIYYVYAYKKTDPDSLNPTIVTADFLSQPGPEGSFWLKYLPKGSYRIFVVEDLNKNLLLDAAFERVGIPIGDADVDTVLKPVGPMNFRITRIDTAVAEVSGARALNNRTVLLRINEVVETLDPEVISIQDTLSGDSLQIINISRNKDEYKQFFIYTMPQDSGDGYRVFVPMLKDTSGNLQTKLQVTDFVGSARRDTTTFTFLKIYPTDSLINLSLSASIDVEFSLPVDTEKVSANFVCQDGDSVEIEGGWEWQNFSFGSFRPFGNFRPGEQYTYSFSTEHLTSLWGDTLADTTYNRTFFTVSDDEFGSISGNYQTNKLIKENIFVILQSLDKRKKSYKTVIDSEKKFHILRIPEGQYKIGGFIDLDDNGKYSPGGLFPFSYSEPFNIMDDTLRIRKRWEFSDINFNIPEN
jgi:hypothetical protein